MSGAQSFLRVVVEDEFTTTEGAISSTEELPTTTESGTEVDLAETTKREEISTEAIAAATNELQMSTENVTIETTPSITEVTIDSVPTTTTDAPSTTTTTEKTTTSEGTTTFVEKHLDLDQVPVNDSSFEHNNLIAKRGVQVEDFKEEVGNKTEVNGAPDDSFSIEEIVVFNDSEASSSTTSRSETTVKTVEVATFAKEGGESTTVMAEKAAPAEDDFAVDFDVGDNKPVVGKRDSETGGKSEEDTLPIEEHNGGLAGRTGVEDMPGMPYDVKPVGFKTVAPAVKQKKKPKVEADHEGKEEAGADVNEGSEEDTLPLTDDGVIIPGVETILAGRADGLGDDLAVGQVGFGLKVEVVDWSSEKDEMGGPWMSAEEESLEGGLGVVDARGWGIEDWIEMVSIFF